MPTPLRAKVATLLEGATLDDVVRLEHAWAFEFSSATLTTATLWRVISTGRFIQSNEDDGQRFDLPKPIDALADVTASLVGRTVRAASVDMETADLMIAFDGGLRLEIISTSRGYEAWQLNTPGSCIVAGNEGRLSEARYAGPQLMIGGAWE